MRRRQMLELEAKRKQPAEVKYTIDPPPAAEQPKRLGLWDRLMLWLSGWIP